MADENKSTDVSGNASGFDIGAAFFGTTAEEPAGKGEEISEEISGGASHEVADDAGEHEPGDGEGASGADEQEQAVEVWQFNDQDYTADQVSDALKHRETFERFNQSITPLIDNIKAFGQTAERLQIMGVTETEKQIDELKRSLASGRLNSREYQEAHQMLTHAETRKATLEQAANQELQQRQQALQTARTHNAKQVATNLVKSGWTKQQMNQAQSLAQQCMNAEQFADSVSVGLMEILRDAFELRSQKSQAAARLQDKARKAVKVGSSTTTATTTKKKTVKAGDPDWMSQHFWKGVK